MPYNGGMYALASKLIGLPILSLQNAESITQVKAIIMEIKSLEVVALACQPRPRLGKRPVLLMRDVRQVAIDCLLVNTEDDIAEAEEVVRLAPLLKRNFVPQGISVVTDLHRRVGRVEDYTINLETYHLQKLYVRRPILRSWMGSSLIIDRAQILEVSEREIIVRDATLTSKAGASLLAPNAVPKQ
jgi:sporulation protein YlmC with PRC-barrel domain